MTGKHKNEIVLQWRKDARGTINHECLQIIIARQEQNCIMHCFQDEKTQVASER